MKAVLMSIKPRWCELISSGKKTVEVRKTKPKIAPPFKVYIYETKDKRYENIGVCGWKEDGTKYIFNNHCGKVIGEFVCDKITKGNFYLKDTCLTSEEYNAYCHYGAPYGWHITDLVIYDKPKELSQVLNRKQAEKCVNQCEHNGMCQYCEEIRPPKSWVYCEEVDE
jgi:predicted transcriptional regulator